MLGIGCALGYILSKLQTNVFFFFFFFYNTDEMVQSPALGLPEPHKLGWGNISGLKKTPLNAVYIEFLTLHSALKKNKSSNTS